MKSFTIFFVVFFSFFAVACGGEEVTLPDNESKTDESIDETPDQTNDDATDNEIDEVSDEDIVETEDETDEDEEKPDENTGKKRTVEDNEDCLSTGCEKICYLGWNQETDKPVKHFQYFSDGNLGNCYITIWFQVDEEDNCYVNSEDGGCGFGINYHLKDTLASELPIEKETDFGGEAGYFIFSELDTDPNVLNWKTFEICTYYEGGVEKDWCEEVGETKYQIEGKTGDYYLKGESNFTPISQ